MSDETIMPFDFPAENPTIIKVIGVGGGGGNAVNHMYKEGIHDVTFVVCNTDNQALAESPVPVKLQLGKEGLGAGNRPERAREAAEESIPFTSSNRERRRYLCNWKTGIVYYCHTDLCLVCSALFFQVCS